MLSLFNNKEFKIRFISISVIIFIFIYPIIHADVYFSDDYARSISSYVCMAEVGRYFSEILIYFLNFNKHVSDTAPLFQILSIFILSFSLSFLSISWKFGRFSSIFGLTLIPCSSFFLENLSYRYDSLPMSLALSCACLAYCKWSRNSRVSFFVKILFILASLNFYQPSINVYLSMMCFGGLLCLWDSGAKESIKFLIYNSFIAIPPLFIYILENSIIGKHTTYYNEHSKHTHNIYDIFKNFVDFLHISFKEFGLNGKGFETFLGVIILCGILKVLWVSYKKYNICGLSISSLYVALSVCSLPGLLIFLKYPTFDPRVFMANGVFLCTYMTILIGRNFEFSKNHIKACFPILALFIQISLSFCWGNALKAQTTLNEYITREILEDFSTVSSSGKDIYIRFVSTSSPVSAQAQAIWRRKRAIFETYSLKFPMIGFLELSQGMHTNEHIILGALTNYRDITSLENENFTINNAQNMLRSCHFQKNIHHRYYDIYADGSNVLVDFTQTCSGRHVK